MNAEEIREYCIKKAMTEESFPFDEATLVFKVCGKIFLLVSLDSAPLQFNAKCEPSRALQLRESHSSVVPGYHMNKNHWNTILIDGTVSRKLLQSWIDDSYRLVVNSLPRRERIRIEELEQKSI
ncbi:MAG: MmcQ/YjbR family DNA-binding protein [bacterium]|nr:MmcQ/YjbR family DNA-binding protein [bacterium]